jgi:hypothetical protein
MPRQRSQFLPEAGGSNEAVVVVRDRPEVYFAAGAAASRNDVTAGANNGDSSML